nr:hypothetical protein [Tanacetum cinerariifolium]
MRDFVKNSSASVYNQGWTMKKFRRSTFHPKPTLDAPPAKRATQKAPSVLVVSSQDLAGVPAAPSILADVSLPNATSSAPADIPVPTVFIAHTTVYILAKPMVHPAESQMDDPLTAPEHGSSEPTFVASPLSSSRHPRKHIAKKQVTPIVDVADAAMIKFDSDNDSDDDPLPYAPYAGWEMVPSPLGSVYAYHNIAGPPNTLLLFVRFYIWWRGLIFRGQLAHSQLVIKSTGTSSCVGDGRWTGNPYVCRCLLSSLCRYFGAYAET